MFVTFASHRARERSEKMIGNLHENYYCLTRNLGYGGTIEITDAEYEKIKNIKGVKKLKNGDNLNHCWSTK
jgi:hypothetical protein